MATRHLQNELFWRCFIGESVVGMREQSIGWSPCLSLPINIGDPDSKVVKDRPRQGCDDGQTGLWGLILNVLLFLKFRYLLFLYPSPAPLRVVLVPWGSFWEIPMDSNLLGSCALSKHSVPHHPFLRDAPEESSVLNSYWEIKRE